MKRLSIKINDYQKFKLLGFCNVILVSVIFLYCLNSFFIKPNIKENASKFNYFMHNYFNDIWAGCFISIIANLLALKKGRIFNQVWFYVIIWFFESAVWEFLRPFILYLFNPLNKSPKFLWGDFLAYAFGTFFVFIMVALIIKKCEHERT